MASPIQRSFYEELGALPVYVALASVLVLLLFVIGFVLMRRRKPVPRPEPMGEPTDPGDRIPSDIGTPIKAELPVAAAAPAVAEEPHGPRRAISLPAQGSDPAARASEQTLKRVSAQQIEADAKLKAPKAGEVAGNPILPDGIVKIRCLACDKKMKADSSKFTKQRRCPNCKAEPFRYVTAI